MTTYQKYIPLVYSRKVNCKTVYIYLMQHEFIPVDVNHTNFNVYGSNQEGIEAIKAMVNRNSDYYERIDKSIRVDNNISKPSLKTDWNHYAIQRLISNDLLEYDNVIIVYSTMHNDIITIRS